VLETLDSMLNQSTASRFLNNVDQAAKIATLVEDIRDAIIDYQVCYTSYLLLNSHDLRFRQTSLQQGLNDTTVTLLVCVFIVN
jgi:hypothetical protein